MFVVGLRKCLREVESVLHLLHVVLVGYTQHPPSNNLVLRLQRYRLSTDNDLNSLREVRVRSQEFAFWRLEESLNNEN